MDALTVKPRPRYFAMVLALAGDSTMSSLPRPFEDVVLAALVAFVRAAVARFFFGFVPLLVLVGMSFLSTTTGAAVREHRYLRERE
jgi:hypothetical protein